MSYLKNVDAWLEERGIEEAEVKEEIKKKIRESYYNGRRDCIKYLYGVLKNLSGGKNGKNDTPKAK